MENIAHRPNPSAEEALQRWGELWEVLGFRKINTSGVVVRAGLIDAEPGALYLVYPQNNGSLNGRQTVRTIPRIDEYGPITPEEADVLSALLLGQ